MKKKKIISLIALNIFLLIGLGWWGFWQYQKLAQMNDIKKCSNELPLISPDIDCSTIDDSIALKESVSNKIEDYINTEKLAKKADEIAVFYRNLDNKQWFGVNENQQFYPASLAKLPTAMMYYKVAEVDKDILETPYKITDDDIKQNESQQYKPPESMVAGQEYSTKELIRRTLMYSDNAPLRILMENSQPFSAPVFLDLGVTYPIKEGDTVGQWNITSKTFSNLFRILYNSSYIRPQYSNTILEQLSQSTFNSGLVAGVPDGTKVSHKFGEASGIDDKTNQLYIVLNDCGIIYKKNDPYILCVMTQGQDFGNLESIIKNISEKVYGLY